YFTGEVEAPFLFDKTYEGRNTIYYRNVLEEVNGEFHVFAGRGNFYSFSLVSSVPETLQAFDLVSDEFYGSVSRGVEPSVFSVDNSITREVWVVLPTKTICYDYQYGTFSTIDSGFTA